MTANFVTVVCDAFYGSGSAITHGTAWFAPGTALTDVPDGMFIPPGPVPAEFRSRVSPTVSLLATDDANVQPSGWPWNVSFAYIPGNPVPYNFFLPAGPASFTASAGTPCVLGWGTTPALTSLPVGTGVQLSGGSVPAAFSTAVTYYVVSPSGTTVSLASSRGGSAIASASGGSGTLTAVQYNLSALTPVGTVSALAGYMPLPSGTPSYGQVPEATGAGQASAWASAGGDISGPYSSLTVEKIQGTAIASNPGGTAAFLRADGNWSVPPGGGGGSVTSVFSRTGAVVAQSGDYTVSQVTGAAPLASPAFTGTPTAPTASPLTDDTQVATTAYADAAVAVETTRAEAAEALKAPLASPALTGTPTAPTQSAGDDSTKIATDAFVQTAIGGAPRDWYNLADYGGDPTGASYSDTALADIITALGSSGSGIIYAEAGSWKFQDTATFELANSQGVIFLGAGLEATTFYFHGTGDFIRMYNGTAWSGSGNPDYSLGCGIWGITIDGANAGSSSNGVHWGDIGELRGDFAVQNFSQTGSIGLLFDNTNTWTEKAHVRCRLTNCTQHVVFTVTTGYNSFGYSDFDFTINAQPNQDGVAVLNGSLIYHGSLRVRGNFQPSASAQSSAVLRIMGDSPSGSPSGAGPATVQRTYLDVMAEVNNSATYAPYTLALGTSPFCYLIGCFGILDFTGGGGTFTPCNVTAVNAAYHISFSGLIAGDANLGPAGSYGLTMAGIPVTYAQSILSSSGAVYTATGDFFSLTLSQNATISLGTALPGPQRKTIIITQAASGGPYTVTWPSPGSPSLANPIAYWPGGVAPVMSTGASVTDVYVLQTVDGIHWYGQPFQGGTPLPVALGGTGQSSLTAYELLAGGTATTSAVQQIGLGTSGQVLTSNGAGALPSMQSLPFSAPPNYGLLPAQLGLSVMSMPFWAISARTQPGGQSGGICIGMPFSVLEKVTLSSELGILTEAAGSASLGTNAIGAYALSSGTWTQVGVTGDLSSQLTSTAGWVSGTPSTAVSLGPGTAYAFVINLHMSTGAYLCNSGIGSGAFPVIGSVPSGGFYFSGTALPPSFAQASVTMDNKSYCFGGD